MVLISIELSEEVAARARKAGMLTSEAIAELIEDKLGTLDVEFGREAKRDQAILRTREMLEKLDALEPKITEAEIEDALREARMKPNG
jgi:hypothetical protein